MSQSQAENLGDAALLCYIHKRLCAANCRLLLNTWLERVEETSIVTMSDGKKKVISPVDQLVLAVGLKSCDDLKRTLKERGMLHHIVGDAAQVCRIIEAVDEGAKAALDLQKVRGLHPTTCCKPNRRISNLECPT